MKGLEYIAITCACGQEQPQECKPTHPTAWQPPKPAIVWTNVPSARRDGCGTTWLTQHDKGIPEVIPAGIVEDDTTGPELDTVGTSGGAEETTGNKVAGGGGTDPAGGWVEAKAFSDCTMFLTKDPRSETTAGVRVVEVGMAGGGTPAANEKVTVVNVVVDERSEPEDMGQQVEIQ